MQCASSSVISWTIFDLHKVIEEWWMLFRLAIGENHSGNPTVERSAEKF
jgi:hypothetical protein